MTDRPTDEQIKDFLAISENVAPEPWEPILLDTDDSLNCRVAALNYVDGCISEGGEDFYLVIAEKAGGDVCHTGNGPTSKTNAIFIAQARALLPALAREVLDRRAAEAAARAGADPDEIGRAAHEAWKRWRIEGGYPDHPYVPKRQGYAMRDSSLCRQCEVRRDLHHYDMIDWADLPDQKKQKYIVQGMAGYESGRAVAQAEGAGLIDLIEAAWGIIANANYGDWSGESRGWREAAERWRDRYHAALANNPAREAVERSDPPMTERDADIEERLNAARSCYENGYPACDDAEALARLAISARDERDAARYWHIIDAIRQLSLVKDSPWITEAINDKALDDSAGIVLSIYEANMANIAVRFWLSELDHRPEAESMGALQGRLQAMIAQVTGG